MVVVVVVSSSRSSSRDSAGRQNRPEATCASEGTQRDTTSAGRNGTKR